MTARVTFYFLIFVLIFQLVTVQPSLLFFQTRTAGDFVAVTERTKQYTKAIYNDAVLSAARQNSFDSVVFTGDVMLGRHVETLMNTHGSEYPYRGFPLRMLSGNPAVVGNFESAIAKVHQQTPANNLRFSVDEAHLEAFSQQFTHASLGNNHSLDYGPEGYQTAVDALESFKVVPFGHNAVISRDSLTYIDTDRGRLALLGINASQRIPATEEIDSLCGKAKRQSDFQIVYIHWGDEYQGTHSETQRVLAEVLVDACADLIIGHHPHVVQDIDIIKGVPVFYSLGNYIFDQYFSQEVKEGLVVVLRLDDEPALELIPIASHDQQSVPTPIEAEKRQVFLKNLAEKSHPSLQSAIESGYVNLLEPVATSTKMAIMWR